MPSSGHMLKSRTGRNNRGQFLILSAVSVAIVMITFASLLASTSVSQVSLTRTNFRQATTEVTLNFRRAVAAAAAEVSKTMDFRASVSRYTNYTSLDEYPEAKLGGYEFITDWQKTILSRYPGLGLNLSTSQPTFQCEWGSSPGYSKASSNISLDILSYGFYGWKSEVFVELNATILNLDAYRTDGRSVSFYIEIFKENGVPVTDLSEATTSVLFQHADSDEFTSSNSLNLTYLGAGYYLAEFSMYSTTIPEGLSEIENNATGLTDDNFIDPYNSTIFCQKIEEVEVEYNASRFEEAYGNLTECRAWIVPNDETTYLLSWIDVVRSQLLPTVRVALQDLRGIVVGAYRTLSTEEDTLGPVTRDLDVSPNPTAGDSSVTLTALVDDRTTGLSNIADAEYFVNSTGESGTGTKMLASDGSFDTAAENVEAQMDVSGWATCNHTIYVHGKDEAGFWGEFSSVTLNVTGTSVMYVESIDMYLIKGFGRFYQAQADVTIVDTGGNPVEDATVHAHWSGAHGHSVQGDTDESGKVSFFSSWRWGNPTFTFTVDNVVKDGYIYDPDLNVETSDTIGP